jgi:ATP-dependent protease ClpP protease subunit
VQFDIIYKQIELYTALTLVFNNNIQNQYWRFKFMSTEEHIAGDVSKEHVLITVDSVERGSGLSYNVYMDKEILSPSKYRNLLEFLDKATEKDTFVLKLNGPGGNLYTCAQIVHAISATKANVIGELVGEVCSAHANIFISCHSHMVHPYSIMMVHTLTSGAYGKGEDVTRMGTANNAITKLMYADLFDGFLSDDELVDVLDNNKDLWFVGVEDINSRLEDLHALRDAAVEEENAEILTKAQDELIAAAAKLSAERLKDTPKEEKVGNADIALQAEDFTLNDTILC